MATDVELVSKEIDGIIFQFKKKSDGTLNESSEEVRFKTTQDGVIYSLRAWYGKGWDGLRIYTSAGIVDFDRQMKHLILPYSIKFKNHEYCVCGIGIDGRYAFPINSSIEELTIGCYLGHFSNKQCENALKGLTNIKKINVLETVRLHLLVGLGLKLLQAQNLGATSKVYVNDDFIGIEEAYDEANESKFKYGKTYCTTKYTGFWIKNGTDIHTLSIPNIGDFITKYECSVITEKSIYDGNSTWLSDKISEERTVTKCPIKNIIMRDVPRFPGIKPFASILKETDLQELTQIFGDVTLYVNKKHLCTLDNLRRNSVFKAIKPFEELPEEDRFLLGDNYLQPQKEAPQQVVSIDLEKLIAAALVDGVVTDKERAILCKKVKEAGGDVDEFEMLLDARIYEAQQKTQQAAPKAEPKKEEPKPAKAETPQPAPKKEEPKSTPAKPATTSSADGKMTVEKLAADFKAQFGSVLRIYNGRSKADDSLSLQEVGLTDNLSLPFDGNQKVGDFIVQMAEIGLKVKVYTCDEWVACLDGLTLTQTGQVKKSATKADMEKML